MRMKIMICPKCSRKYVKRYVYCPKCAKNLKKNLIVAVIHNQQHVEKRYLKKMILYVDIVAAILHT